MFDLQLGHRSKVMALAVDESTDRRDVAELCLYVGSFDGDCFREDALGLLLNVNNMIPCCLMYLWMRPFILMILFVNLDNMNEINIRVPVACTLLCVQC